MLDYSSLLVNEYPDSVISLCTNSLKEAENKNLPNIEIDILNMIGFAWGLKGDNDQQIDYYEQCLALSEDLGYGAGICTYYVNMGMKSTNEDNFNNAIKLFKQSLKVSEEYGIHDNDHIILNNIALSYFSVGDYKNAITYYSMALDLLINKNDSLGISQSYHNIGDCYFIDEDFENALLYQLKNSEISEKLKSPQRIAIANYSLSNTYLSLKEYDKAMDHLRRAKQLFLSLNDQKMIAYSEITEGYIWLGIRNFLKARDHCEMASKLLGEEAEIDKKIEICDCLTSAYKNLGDFEKAIKNMEISQTLSSGIIKLGAAKELQKTEFEKQLLADSLTNVAIRHQLEMTHEEELRKNNTKKNIFTFLIIIILIFGGLWSRLRYIRRTNIQLEKAKNLAEESEQMKQQFLANMSHEIRTPMNAVLGITNLVLDTSLSVKQKKYLNALKSSSLNLLSIINDILDISKLEAGKMEIEHIPFDLDLIIEDVINTLRYKAEEKGLQIEFSEGKDVPKVIIGDPGRLNQILLNLCGNAIKFTEKGKIKIEIQKIPNSDAHLEFKITDTGIGINKVQINKLFDAFEQEDISISRKYGGTGLGLAISKTLIELQKGEINVKSEVGIGSEFTFNIPYLLGKKEDLIVLNENDQNEFSILKGIRILIAEDNELNQMVINDTLENLIEDVTISIVENGKEAIEMLENNDYDIILMDVQMPVVNGLEATKYIRKKMKGNKKNIPIIALTASVLKSDTNKCIDVGMNAIVPKPFRRIELLTALRSYYSNGQKTEISKELKVDPKVVEDTPVGDKITDLDFLINFCDSDKLRIKKYIDMYLDLTPINIEKIRSYFENENYQALSLVIHSMKAHYNFMGMSSTRVLANEIEELILKDSDSNLINEKIDLLIKNTMLSVKELSKMA